MKKISLNKAAIVLAALSLLGCDKQRDLYSISHPMLLIEGDWMPSLGRSNMSQDATAMAFGSDGSSHKAYFINPDNTTLKLTRDTYDVLVFNGLMFSAQSTHLSNVCFRGIETASAFEAYAAEGTAISTLGRETGETIASNDMEILTSASAREYIAADNGYYLKYRNGKNGFPAEKDYIESTLHMTPTAVSYISKLIVRLVNPRSALAAAGAVRGFAGSVYMSPRMPAHQSVTHHLPLNNMKLSKPAGLEERGSIESAEFVTFGPPLDLPGRIYEARVRILLKDNSVVDKTFDVTDQITPVIERIKKNLGKDYPVETNITIPIIIELTLPAVTGNGSIDVGIGDWGDDEMIIVPITL